VAVMNIDICSSRAACSIQLRARLRRRRTFSGATIEPVCTRLLSLYVMPEKASFPTMNGCSCSPLFAAGTVDIISFATWAAYSLRDDRHFALARRTTSRRAIHSRHGFGRWH